MLSLRRCGWPANINVTRVDTFNKILLKKVPISNKKSRRKKRICRAKLRMYSILHYITNCLYFHYYINNQKKKKNVYKHKNECTVESRKHTINVTKMLHVRWVSFLGIQRVCDNQDFIETEQLKAYSRVFSFFLFLSCFLNLF